MTEKIRHRNWLIVQGRLIADGKVAELTAERWLYLYDQIKDDLASSQAAVFADLETRIRKRQANLTTGNAA